MTVTFYIGRCGTYTYRMGSPENMNVVIYCRISQDKTEDEVAVERQEAECMERAQSLGLTVTRTYVDNDISATKGKERPQFEQLLKDKPSAIIVWHQDRLLRTGKDVERVIDLNVPVYMVTAGTLDLATPSGRAVARTLAAWAQYEGEQKALRQQSKNRQMVESGLPVPGRRRFGYRNGNVVEHPEEGQIVRWMFKEFLAGSSVGHLSRETGMRPQRVRETLLNPAYAGWVTRRGERFPAHESVARLVTPEDFEKVQTRLDANATLNRHRKARAGSTNRGGVVTHLASGIATCGVCGGPLQYRNNYLCLRNLKHPTIKREYMDEKIVKELAKVLLLPGSEDADTTSAELIMLEMELVMLGARKADILTGLSAGLSMSDLKPHLNPVIERIDYLLDRRADLLAENVQVSILQGLRNYLDVETHRASFDLAAEEATTLEERITALALEKQRELVRSRLVISLHHGKRGPERIHVARKQRESLPLLDLTEDLSEASASQATYDPALW